MKYLLTILLLTTYGLSATFNVSTTPELRTALETAATNGEDDTIILADGTYKTTDDAGGTFIYLSNEANKLTLQGSSSENVILSGDSTDQILNHQSTEDAPMTLEKLSFVEGNITEGLGGGVYTDYSIVVTDCNFTNNSARSSKGGGFYSSRTSTTVTNSTFTNNSAKYGGGGFASYASSITVTNSTFTNNSASHGGGFASYASSITVTNSTFTNNSSNYAGGSKGGGFYSSYDSRTSTTVTNSTFTNNSADNGGGFASYASSTTVTNSIFTNNSAEDKGGGIYIGSGEDHVIVNSIFKDNNTSDIDGGLNVIIPYLENNYLDTSKVTISNFKKNNIFEGVNLGFVDEANGDYNLTASSDLIDAGTTDITDLILPTEDLNGNARIAGATIDIGPYEFSSTKPTISTFTYTGTAKELSQLTFSVDYTLADDGRTLDNITYDYTNDGSWSAVDTHTFDTAGTYTVNAKVTDSEGEHSSTSLQVMISEIGLQDKLLSELTQEQIDIILPFIESDKTSAVTSATTTALENGKNYVLNNLNEFNLTTEETKDNLVSVATDAGYSDGLIAGKQYVQDNPSEFNLVTVADNGSDYADFDWKVDSLNLTSLTSGWTLLGTPIEITDLSVFDNVNLVWIYDKDSTTPWSAYSSNQTTKQAIEDTNIPLINSIPANSGIWVNK